MTKLNEPIHVGQGLRRIRLFHGFRQKEVSIGRPISAVNAHERGNKPISLNNLIAYAEFYNLTPHELLFFIENYDVPGVSLPEPSHKLRALISAIQASQL